MVEASYLAMDRNGDGTLSRSEFVRGSAERRVPRKEAREFFDEEDANEDEALDFVEYLNAAAAWSVSAAEDGVASARHGPRRTRGAGGGGPGHRVQASHPRGTDLGMSDQGEQLQTGKAPQEHGAAAAALAAKDPSPRRVQASRPRGSARDPNVAAGGGSGHRVQASHPRGTDLGRSD